MSRFSPKEQSFEMLMLFHTTQKVLFIKYKEFILLVQKSCVQKLRIYHISCIFPFFYHGAELLKDPLIFFHSSMSSIFMSFKMQKSKTLMTEINLKKKRKKSKSQYH